MAGTALQNLWNRYHPLPRLSERKDVQDWAVAPLSMPQPLVVEINLMNHKTSNNPTSCEKDILFRQGPLLPKTTHHRSSRPSIDRSAKRSALVTNPHRYKSAHNTPCLLACQ